MLEFIHFLMNSYLFCLYSYETHNSGFRTYRRFRASGLRWVWICQRSSNHERFASLDARLSGDKNQWRGRLFLIPPNRYPESCWVQILSRQLVIWAFGTICSAPCWHRIQYSKPRSNESVVGFGIWYFKNHPIAHAIDYSLLSRGQVGFSTMSATALAPFTCYTHPNQQLSLLKFPNVCLGRTCWAFFCLHAFGNQKTHFLTIGMDISKWLI